jgi:DNA-binding CsgD family transcriptional regulator
MRPGPARPRADVVGRRAERARLDAFAAALRTDPRSLVIVGEAGIGKTILWQYGTARCRSGDVSVLVARPTEDERNSPGQGLRDLFDRQGDAVDDPMHDADLPAAERSRLVLAALRGLATRGPVVLAVDDLPWLDDVTARALRFVLRRLVDEPVALLATARTWSPTGSTALDTARGVDVLEVGGMPAPELRRAVLAAVPATTVPMAIQVVDLAHGNPFFAIELARARPGSGSGGLSGSGHGYDGSPLSALAHRVAQLPEQTRELARVLAVAGPSLLPVLAAVTGPDGQDEALRAGLDADVLHLDEHFVVRFSHPLIASAVLTGMNALDRRRLHADLAAVVTDPDVRAVHLARGIVGPDAAAADEIEVAAPRLAAELLGHAVRLTPPSSTEACVVRGVAQAMQSASAGDIGSAAALADELLDRLAPGPLRAEVMATRIFVDFSDAERFLRAGLDEVPEGGPPDHESFRGRLLGMLGWLLAVHLGRVEEGRRLAEAGLAIGRAHGDVVLVAQAASAVSTAALLAGRRADGLMAEAVALGADVVRSQLGIWPRALRGRQQLWDGDLTQARASFEAMYRHAAARGSEFQRPYRLCDLALVELAAGDLDRVVQHVEDAVEAAQDCGDERATAWLAYPGGMARALRGEADAARADADRLDRWAAIAAERPRAAMAAHVRGVLAGARQDWTAALQHLVAASTALDAMGYVHPGAVPVLPQAVHFATLAGLEAPADDLVEQLRGRCADLGSRWADAQALSATGMLRLLRDEPQAGEQLAEASAELAALGYQLDAARAGYFAAVAAAREGRRSAARRLADEVLGTFGTLRVRGWEEIARDLVERVGGPGVEVLTATEAQIAAYVADGRRNREIAERLFVVESTVEAHLTRIYRKLGLRNRAELTRHVARTVS